MNKSELIEITAKEADISKAAAEKALSAVMGAIVKAVSKGDAVTLVGFGSFKSSKRAARVGRNPTQIEKADADPKHKMALVFRAYLGQASKWAIAGDAMCSASNSGLDRSRPSPASEILMPVARTSRS